MVVVDWRASLTEWLESEQRSDVRALIAEALECEDLEGAVSVFSASLGEAGGLGRVAVELLELLVLEDEDLDESSDLGFRLESSDVAIVASPAFPMMRSRSPLSETLEDLEYYLYFIVPPVHVSIGDECELRRALRNYGDEEDRAWVVLAEGGHESEYFEEIKSKLWPSEVGDRITLGGEPMILVTSLPLGVFEPMSNEFALLCCSRDLFGTSKPQDLARELSRVLVQDDGPLVALKRRSGFRNWVQGRLRWRPSLGGFSWEEN